MERVLAMAMLTVRGEMCQAPREEGVAVAAAVGGRYSLWRWQNWKGGKLSAFSVCCGVGTRVVVWVCPLCVCFSLSLVGQATETAVLLYIVIFRSLVPSYR